MPASCSPRCGTRNAGDLPGLRGDRETRPRRTRNGRVGAWLNNHDGEPLVASALVEVEVPRALRRHQPATLGAVAGVLARLYRIQIDESVRATAAAYVDPQLRSLGAVHLATADLLVSTGRNLSWFVTYDKRLTLCVEAAGLPVAAPGTG